MIHRECYTATHQNALSRRGRLSAYKSRRGPTGVSISSPNITHAVFGFSLAADRIRRPPTGTTIVITRRPQQVPFADPSRPPIAAEAMFTAAAATATASAAVVLMSALSAARASPPRYGIAEPQPATVASTATTDRNVTSAPAARQNGIFCVLLHVTERF